MMAIRRWGDACFHLVDEVVEEGYILGSVLIPHHDVLEVRPLELDGEGHAVAPTCSRRIYNLKLPRVEGTGA